MTATTSYFRRPIYRAPSPPTWACYEQIPRERGGYSDSDDSCSDSDSCDSECDEDEENDNAEDGGDASDDVQNMDMDIEADANVHIRRSTDDEDAADVETVLKADVKGKQRAVEHAEPEMSATPKVVHKRSPRKHREPVYDPRPILTIHKSQGFVWNQVCQALMSIIIPSETKHPTGPLRASLR